MNEEATVADGVEVYHRTYSTVLRSSGETRLRVLEASHKAMESSLHPLANSDEIDLGAFLYACRRLPDVLHQTHRIIMGQAMEVFSRQGFADIEQWEELSAPGRRRRWYSNGEGTLGVLIASASDVDDLIPTLVAYQIEWNKLHVKLHATDTHLRDDPGGALCDAIGGNPDDWAQLCELWGDETRLRLDDIANRKRSIRIRLLGGTQVGYARVTRRWWQQVTGVVRSENLTERPVYFVSSNTHSLANLVTGLAQSHEDEIVSLMEQQHSPDLDEELALFRRSEAEGNWNNFLFFGCRYYLRKMRKDATGRAAVRKEIRDAGVLNVTSRTALDVAAQIIPLDRLDVAHFDNRLGPVDANSLKRSSAIVINIDYPLGLAAYNILREAAETVGELRGVYVLGKAATLNADVGDVMISSVIHDEHSGCTYWLDNAFSVSDIAPYLRFGSGLDNQRAVSVKGTFLQNRGYLDFYYREAFTVIEMEAGPYCNAVYEMSEQQRFPTQVPVNFSKLPIDFGVIHYASDTPLTQARTLGARGLSYYGMDSTYASSVAIWRRILGREGALLPTDEVSTATTSVAAMTH